MRGCVCITATVGIITTATCEGGGVQEEEGDEEAAGASEERLFILEAQREQTVCTRPLIHLSQRGARASVRARACVPRV